MNISKEQVKHIADLSKLCFDEQEIEKLTADLSSIVSFAEELNELDTSNVEPTNHILDVKNILRKDEVKPSYERSELLRNAKEKEMGCVIVPKTVE